MIARRRLTLTAVLVTALLGPTTACGGSQGSTEDVEQSLTSAKQQLDETPGLRLDLSSDALPDGIDGLTGATGVATHAPAFDGEVELLVGGLTLEVPLVAVEGQVYAKLPFTPDFEEIDPVEYGAPDPAQLMDPTVGLSAWLVEAVDVTREDQVREGETVLTSYSGTLAGDVVARVIPSAEETARYEVTFLLDDDDQLRSVEVAGPFYEEGSRVEYLIALSEYGSDPRITRP